MPAKDSRERLLRGAAAGDVAECESALVEPSAAGAAGAARLVDAVDEEGRSALHFAAGASQPLLLALLKHKPDLGLRARDGVTALDTAAQLARHDAVAALVDAGADINGEDSRGVTAGHRAALAGHTATVQYLVSLGFRTARPVCPSGTVLHWGCNRGNPAAVGALIYDLGMDVNAVDACGCTPLHTALPRSTSNDSGGGGGSAAAAVFLLEHGANPSAVTDDGATLLHFAVALGAAALPVLRPLLAFGANPLALDSSGRTAAELAAELAQGDAVRELAKPPAAAGKRAEDAARFKAHGNRVFLGGENVKAAKFYTLGIQCEPRNHVFFSNRSACHYNTGQLSAALFDARRCVALAPKWPKGYMRTAATLSALERVAEAKAVCVAGLDVDGSNAELKSLLKSL